MTTTIRDAFLLPAPEDIRAMGFVVKLREAAPDGAETRRLVDDYVVTPVVARELPRILDDLKQVFDRGEEYGRFVHGSFGSGKSHLLTMLGLLLERTPVAWDKFRPLFAAHRAEQAAKGHAAADPEQWLPAAAPLVVRIHMLSARGRTTGLDRIVYEGFNAALAKRGQPPFEFVDAESVLQEVRREAAEFGDVVWKRLEAAGIVGGKADFEELVRGGPAGREAFARAWLGYKGRDPSQAGLDPRWSEGLKRMGAHARACGFRSIVLLVDEFLLWLAEKSGQEFVREINNLNVIVDHDTGQRPLPVAVFVARQRNLREFFPDLVDEGKIHEHLDHHAKRFEETRLQDVELRHIVRGRVLKPRDPAAVARAVAGLAQTHEKILPALLTGGDLDYLRDVYPFHPALIEALVDVTSLMQRERSALRLLYELLVLHHPDLPVGEFLPVGSAFPAIFPESGVEASKKIELMQDVHRQYYERLAPALRQMVGEGTIDEERRRALDQLVRTVLLAEVSPRLKQGGLTVERLVQLNSVDVEGETFRGRLRVAETDLLSLAQKVPDLQVAGQGKTALVRYVLGKVSLGEILARARSKVDNPQQRFKVFWAALKAALGLEGTKGFEEAGPNEGDWELSWRRTRRRGSVKLGNVRELSYDDFAPPPGAFKVLVDYPWDEPGHTVDEDRLRAMNVRKMKGALYSVCWLPRHLSPTELGVLTELAAVRYLLSTAGQEDLLETVGPQDRGKVLDQAQVRGKTLEGQLAGLLREVYVEHGEWVALISDVDGSRPRETLQENLEHVAALLMDRRYPQHPHFGAEPRKADLELLLGWMVSSGDGSTSIAYDDATGKVLKTLGQPLELVNLGQTKAALRLDSRYVKDVLQRVEKDSVAWAPIAEHLRDTYGFQPLVVDLFLAFLCQRDHRALSEPDGAPVEVRLGMPAGGHVRLQRGEVVKGAGWHRLRDLASHLFGEPRPPAQPSLQAQDRLAARLREHGEAKRAVLHGLHDRLVHLGVEGGARLAELAEASARLAPLVARTSDSYPALSDLLARWPDAPDDPLRGLVHGVEAIRDALGALNENARKNLRAGAQHPTLGERVRDHLAALDRRLAAAQAEQPLDRAWVAGWNRTAEELVHGLITPVVVPVAPVGPVGPVGPGWEPPLGGVPADGHRPGEEDDRPPPRPPAATILCERTLDPGDPDDLTEFLGAVRQALQGLAEGPGRVRVRLVRDTPAGGARTDGEERN
jgi:hypothetical protein